MTPPKRLGQVLAGSPILKALPTEYRGLQFRSRLEARWAVFYDALGIPYEYEREGYDLNGIWYLPDFWIPTLDAWIEIKPCKLTDDETDKCRELAVTTNKEVYAFTSGFVLGIAQSRDPISANVFKPVLGGMCDWDDDYWWCECHDCHSFGIEHRGRSDRMRCKECFQCWQYRTQYANFDSADVWWADFKLNGKCPSGKRCGKCPKGYDGDKGWSYNSYQLQQAYNEAATVKFI